MDEIKNYIMTELEELHIKLFYGSSYDNTMAGTFEKLKDQVRYEELQEVLRKNPNWDIQELGIELSERIRGRKSYW